MLLEATLFVAMFIFVFLKAIQQQNVVFKKYALVVPTSVAMAYTEIYVVASATSQFIKTGGLNHSLLLAIGLGGGLGCLLAMKYHLGISELIEKGIGRLKCL